MKSKRIYNLNVNTGATTTGATSISPLSCELNPCNFVGVSKSVAFVNKVTSGEVKNIGTIINMSETLAHMSLLKDDKFIPLMKFALLEIAKNNEINVNVAQSKSVGKMYSGLQTFKCRVPYLNGEVENEFVFIDEHVQVYLLRDMMNCDWNNVSNLRRMNRDLNHIMRCCGERTIDALKKLYKIFEGYFIKTVVALSTQHVDSNIKYFTLKAPRDGKPQSKLEIKRHTKYDTSNYIMNEAGDIKDFKGTDGTIEKIVYNDNLGDMQNVLFASIEVFANEDARKKYQDVIMPESILDELESKNLYYAAMDVKRTIVSPYGKIVANNIKASQELDKIRASISEDEYLDKQEELKLNEELELESLSSMYRNFVRINGISIADAGLILLVASSCHVGDGGRFVVSESGNSCFLNVCKEYFLAYVGQGQDTMVELLGNTFDLEDGDTITLNCGDVSNSLYTESKYTGKCTVKTIDEVRYATKSVEDVLTEISKKYNNNSDSFSFTVYKEHFVDIASLQQGKFKTCNDMKYFNEAIELGCTFKFIPLMSYKLNEVQYVEERMLVAVYPKGVLSEKEEQLPILRFGCNSNELQNVYAGVSFDASSVDITVLDKQVVVSYTELDRINVDKSTLVDYTITNQSHKNTCLDGFGDFSELEGNVENDIFKGIDAIAGTDEDEEEDDDYGDDPFGANAYDIFGQ